MSNELVKQLTTLTKAGKAKWQSSGSHYRPDDYYMQLDGNTVELKKIKDWPTVYRLYVGSQKVYDGVWTGRQLFKAIEDARDRLVLARVQEQVDALSRAIDEMEDD